MADLLTDIFAAGQQALGAAWAFPGAVASFLGSIPGGIATSLHDAAVKLGSVPGDVAAANAVGAKSAITDFTSGLQLGLINTGAGVQSALSSIGAGAGAGGQAALSGVGAGAGSAISSVGSGLGAGEQAALGGVGKGIAAVGAGAGSAATSTATGLNTFIPLILVVAVIAGGAWLVTRGK